MAAVLRKAGIWIASRAQLASGWDPVLARTGGRRILRRTTGVIEKPLPRLPAASERFGTAGGGPKKVQPPNPPRE